VEMFASAPPGLDHLRGLAFRGSAVAPPRATHRRPCQAEEAMQGSLESIEYPYRGIWRFVQELDCHPNLMGSDLHCRCCGPRRLRQTAA